MKTLKKAMVAIFSLTIFFACESEEVSPINPAAPHVSSGVSENFGEIEFQEYDKRHFRPIEEVKNETPKYKKEAIRQMDEKEVDDTTIW